jgi:predicted HicB family RNase H-like nuclease
MPKAEAKTQWIIVRTSPEDKAEVSNMAEESGLSIADLIRRALEVFRIAQRPGRKSS